MRNELSSLFHNIRLSVLHTYFGKNFEKVIGLCLDKNRTNLGQNRVQKGGDFRLLYDIMNFQP